jgi:transposase-like protein
MSKRYLSQEQCQSIVRLKAEGATVKNIARTFGVSEPTVYNIAAGRTRARARRQQNGQQDGHEPVFQEVDFSALPDEVLFTHVRIWDFIG